MESFFNWLSANRHFSKGSLHTLKTREDCLKKWLSGKKLTSPLCQKFILHLRASGRANSTINGYILLFKLYDAYFASRGLKRGLAKDIEFFPKIQRLPTILSVEEIEKIIYSRLPYNECRGFSPARHKYLENLMKLSIWFLASTGCRIDEMACLKKEKLFLGEKSYAQFVDTKTYLDRRVPLPPSLSCELKDYVKDKKPNDLVFTSSRGGKIIEQTYNPLLRKKVESAGINKHVYAHCFRNSYIMEHLNCGTDVLTIAKLVGHADVNTTMGYTKFNYEMLERGAANHPLFSKSLTPCILLKKTKEVIDKMPILKDYRFSFREEVRNNSLLFEVYLK